MTRHKWLGGAAVMAALLIGGSTLLAKQGVVKLKDGSRSLVGDVDETGDNGVVVSIHGVQTTIPRDNIESIEYPESLDAQYKSRLAKLAPDDAKGRFDLAHWAFDNERYDLARDAAYQARKLDPNNKEYADFTDTVDHQMILEARHAANTGGTSVTTTPPAAGDSSPKLTTRGVSELPERRYLSPADINVIKQVELRSDEANINVRFDNNVKQRYLSSSGADPRQFNSLRPIEQAQQILHDSPSMSDDVKITTDPAVIMEYRTKVQPIVQAGCATAACHGGLASGNLVLFTPADNASVWYTNYYILHEYSKSGHLEGGSTSVKRLMVDITRPTESLLLQYGLPPSVASIPHPDVQGFTPVYHGADDPRYKVVETWIGELNPIANYRISYTPPGKVAAVTTAPPTPASGPATKPAATPSTRPSAAHPATRPAGRVPPKPLPGK
jgi:hypothetical protein